MNENLEGRLRVCRVCLTAETEEAYQLILHEDYQVAVDLFYVCGIEIVESATQSPALICATCKKELKDAARLKKVAILADRFFRKCSKELEELFYSDFKETDELIVESLDPEEEYEIIEYDETVAPMSDTEVYVQEVPPKVERVVEAKPARKTLTPRKLGTDRKFNQCECGRTFSSSHRLRNHIRVKHEFVPESELLPCVLCDKKFKLQEYLDLHVRNKHSNNPLKRRQNNPCLHCGKVLSSLVALRNHEEKHLIDAQIDSQIKKFGCDICGQSFRMKSYLFNHMHNVHIRAKYICTFCSKGFYKKYEMNDHVRQAHTMETPFECETCGKSFARKKNLMIHRRIHTGERPYPCTICDKSFMHFIDRKRHLMKHTGDRPYHCELCNKGFMRKGEFDNHARAHYG